MSRPDYELGCHWAPPVPKHGQSPWHPTLRLSLDDALAMRKSHANLDCRRRSRPAREFGHLAQVLNDTSARLQAAFERQVQFPADAAHELRTPVSVVLTQTALSRERPTAE